MLEVRDLSVSYGQHRALDGSSLQVDKGEIVVILGANGAGKTTLLKAVGGICEGRVTGSVRMSGEEILEEKPHRIVEAGLALVPEGRGVFGDLNVQENLTLGAYAARARDDEAGNLDRVFSLFPRLAERRNQIVRTMSGGEQQMVAIGRAMMSNPQILALDEPSLGLAPLLSKDLFQSLRALRDTGLGILLVEQNAKQSLKIADRGYLLENGEIVHEDTADNLRRDPEVQKVYLGGSGGGTASRPPKPMPKSGTVPRPAAGPSPAEIAAQALSGLGRTDRQAPPPRTNGSAPAVAKPPESAVPDVGDLVSRAAASASTRDRPPPVKVAPPSPRATAPERAAPASSTDRLRSVLDEIEAAARRAESYKPRDPRR